MRYRMMAILPALGFMLAFGARAVFGQNATSVTGTVADPMGAVIPDATVTLSNPVSGFSREVTTGGDGKFAFYNVPFNPYQLKVLKTGFQSAAELVDAGSTLAVNVPVTLKVGESDTVVNVEAPPDLTENDPTAHTDIDRGLFRTIPLESQSSSLSSLVTLASPGIAADSNGLFHGLGDHASNSFSVDGQPITDQVSKVFSNQLPTDSVQSLEVIGGAPPAEFGGKTSVVIVATTRSGLGETTPHGELGVSYGTFGSSLLFGSFGSGSEKIGNFFTGNGLQTGRFLDPPEFVVMHDKGNEENFFDRLDYKPTDADALQLNVNFTRSWFQTPNSFDQQFQTCTVLSAMCNADGTTVVNPITGDNLGATDQRSQIRTFNVAPEWTRTLSPNAIFNLGAYVRHDQYNYYPSNNYFDDLGPLQDESVQQLRFLTNAGIRSAVTYAHGINNVKLGAQFQHTFLTENDAFGIVNPGLLSSCPGGFTEQCATLVPYDLTTGGSFYYYHGHTDVKEVALYLQDEITKGPWAANVGMRADFYNGLQTSSKQAEPRVGVSYNIAQTKTVLRLSYARTMESPFNENLVLSSIGCTNAVIDAVMTVAQGFACQDTPLHVGFRNEFHAGFQQAAGKYFVVSGEWISKYTHNGYDFNVFGTTPITLPIEWHNSKIPGYTLQASVPNLHGFSAQVVMSSVAARFFPPTVAGIAPPAPPAVFRIDHDERFNETTHLQYQFGQRMRGLWYGMNWRYDSGLVAGSTPCQAQTATCSFSTSMYDPGGMGLANVPAGYVALVNNVNGLPLTADQEFQSGLVCDGVAATPFTPLPSQCLATQLTSSLVKIPAPNTEQDDHNPQRIQPRNLFDMSLGADNLWHFGENEQYKIAAKVTAINVTNKYALYNFLSTFSGTHYVTPRTVTGEVSFHF